MITFKEYVELHEKSAIKTGGGWIVLKLDNDTSVMTNIEMMLKKTVHYSLNGSIPKTISIKNGLIPALNLKGIMLDVKDKKTAEFISQVQTSCAC